MQRRTSRRSYRVHQNHVDRVRVAFHQSRYRTQQELAIAVSSSQPVISQFMTGEPVECGTFLLICERLNLNSEEIIDRDLQTGDSNYSNPASEQEFERGATGPSDLLSDLLRGELPLDSPFYIERPLIEQRCYAEIGKPGSLIRIKAPRQMGKSSLLARILDKAEQQGDRTVRLTLENMNQSFLSSSDAFLRWLCANLARQLHLPHNLDHYWEHAEVYGSNTCCQAYFEEYLLPEIRAPLTLGLDEVDRVFEFQDICRDFFGLLRAVHEAGRRNVIWQNFRLVIVHSTEVYIPLDINRSPFNVGLPIELPEFTPAQAQDLAQRYQLAWGIDEIQRLMAVIGGHPFLLRQAMDCIARQERSLAQVLATACTETGIYIDYLHRLEQILNQYSELAVAMREVATVTSPVRLVDVSIRYKLQGLGLVKLNGDEATPRCELYRKYFRQRL